MKTTLIILRLLIEFLPILANLLTKNLEQDVQKKTVNQEAESN